MKKEILIVFVAALVVRLAYVAVVPPRPMELDDTFQWNNTAYHFLRGDGFLKNTENLDPKRAPVYPLFLAANYYFFGKENFTAVKISQAVAGALICVGIYAIGVMLFGNAIALTTALLSAVYPPLIVYVEILQTENLFTFLFMLFSLVWIYSLPKSGMKPAVFSGILLGLLNLCRGTMIFFPFFVLGMPLCLKEGKRKFVQYGVLAVVSFLVVAPWTWRNYKVYNAFIPIVAGGPQSLWFGTLPMDEQRLFGNGETYLKLDIPISTKEFEEYFKRLAIDRIMADPVGYAVITVKKFFFFLYKPVGHDLMLAKSSFLAALLMGGHLLLLLLAGAGIYLTRSRYAQLFPLYLLMAYFTLLHTLLTPLPRYRLPIEPFFILFAVAALFRLWEMRPHTLRSWGQFVAGKRGS